MDDQKDNLKQAIRQAVQALLPGAEVRFDPYLGYGKLHPIVVWDGFHNQSFLERQQLVWDTLRRDLTEEQRLATGFLLLVAPAEINAMQEVAA